MSDTSGKSESANEDDLTPAASSPRDAPYSIYTRREKWLIVALVALAGFFSPLPANIYFPAIPMLAKEFHQSIESMNQTVTVYLVFQGISPMLWGPLSDRFGRRLVFLVCLSILVASSIGLALCSTESFWLLLFLRCFQSGGSASTIALGAGVIGDIATTTERGGYFGMFNLGPMLAPCIAPAAGGALAQSLGWRSIFWLIVIMVAVCLLFIACFLPETLRAIAGNGSISVPRHQRPILQVIGPKIDQALSDDAPPQKKQSVNPFVLFTYPDVLVLVSFTGIVYAVNYTVTATISSSFAAIYPHLSETALGLCYLPTGAGMIIGSTLTGKMLDWDYARIKAQKGDDNFSIEHARLRMMPLYLALFVCSIMGWGWCLHARTHISVPLILSIILGWTTIGILNTTMTLNIDILQSRSSGATACTNLVRCSLAAILVSTIDRMTVAMGTGWTYTFWSALCALLLPLMLLEIKMGPRWRRKRDAAEKL